MINIFFYVNNCRNDDNDESNNYTNNSKVYNNIHDD